jgi:hypothetical protein
LIILVQLLIDRGVPLFQGRLIGQRIDRLRTGQDIDLMAAWLKARDAGLQLYLAAFSPAEKERRRLQFLIDVSRAEAETDEEAAAGQ